MNTGIRRNAPAMFRVMARALRPGGVPGLVTHRAPPGWTADDAGRTGYVAQALVIEMAEAAGLVLEASSEINANPRDTHDHEAGVWTLPPSFAVCGEAEDADERVACVSRYREIWRVRPHDTQVPKEGVWHRGGDPATIGLSESIPRRATRAGPPRCLVVPVTG